MLTNTVGVLVKVSKEAPKSKHLSGWISQLSDDGDVAAVLLQGRREIVQVETRFLTYPEEKFTWPRGTYAQMRVLSNNSSLRLPAEAYFSASVVQDIQDVRNGTEYANLWLLIDSLKNLTDPEVTSGFHTWLWAMERTLGVASCKQIGETVCDLLNFTIEEGEVLWNGAYRLHEADRFGLSESASWQEVAAARQQYYEAQAHSA